MAGDLIQTPQTRWIQGAYESVSGSGSLQLYCYILGDVAGVRFSTVRLQGATTGYQVTAGKTLHLTRIRYWADAANSPMSVGYSDADLGLSAAADGANPVNLDSPSANGYSSIVSTAAYTMYDVNVQYKIPSSKYPRIVVPSGAVSKFFLLFGHEE